MRKPQPAPCVTRTVMHGRSVLQKDKAAGKVPIFLDVGSNVGSYSAFACSLGARVSAIEAVVRSMCCVGAPAAVASLGNVLWQQKDMFTRTEKAMEHNGCKPSKSFNAAVSKRDGDTVGF